MTALDFAALTVQQILDLQKAVKTGRRSLDFREQAALLDVLLKAKRYKIQTEQKLAAMQTLDVGL